MEFALYSGWHLHQPTNEPPPEEGWTGNPRTAATMGSSVCCAAVSFGEDMEEHESRVQGGILHSPTLGQYVGVTVCGNRRRSTEKFPN